MYLYLDVWPYDRTQIGSYHFPRDITYYPDNAKGGRMKTYANFTLMIITNYETYFQEYHSVTPRSFHVFQS